MHLRAIKDYLLLGRGTYLHRADLLHDMSATSLVILYVYVIGYQVRPVVLRFNATDLLDQ